MGIKYGREIQHAFKNNSTAFSFFPFVGFATGNNMTSSVLQKRTYKPGDRIAIIGSGACGLAVARSLVDSGVAPSKIQILEKSDQVGGKVQTVTVDGRPFHFHN
jgi:ribulose 1,5-bisphosphate synthetase/thiazole synthase